MTHATVTVAPLTTAQADRAAGVLVGLACGDALGAGYEFQPARIHPRAEAQPRMLDNVWHVLHTLLR